MPLPTRAALVAVLAVFANPALAADQLGSITGTLDGEARIWRTLDLVDEGTATATVRSFGPIATLDIQGHDPEAESLMRGVLSINIGVMGAAAAPQLMDASVSYFPDGLGQAFYIADEEVGTVEIAFEHVELSGQPTATGSVIAELCHKSGIFAAADEDDCLLLVAQFETQLRAEN